MKTQHIIRVVLFSTLLLGNAVMLKGSNPAANADSLTHWVKWYFGLCKFRLGDLNNLRGKIIDSEVPELVDVIVKNARYIIHDHSTRNLNDIENAYVGLTFLETFCSYQDTAGYKIQLLRNCENTLTALITKLQTLDISSALAHSNIQWAYRALALLEKLPENKNVWEPYRSIIENKQRELQELYNKEESERNTIMNVFNRNALTLSQAQAYYEKINDKGYIDRFCVMCTHTITKEAAILTNLDEQQKKAVALSTIENACAGLWLLHDFEHTLGNAKLSNENLHKATALLDSFRYDKLNSIVNRAIVSADRTEKDEGIRVITLLERFFTDPTEKRLFTEKKEAIYPSSKSKKSSRKGTGSTPGSQSGSSGKPKAKKSDPSTVKSSKTSWFTLKRLLLIGGSLTIATLLGAAAYQKWGTKKPQPKAAK